MLRQIRKWKKLITRFELMQVPTVIKIHRKINLPRKSQKIDKNSKVMEKLKKHQKFCEVRTKLLKLIKWLGGHVVKTAPNCKEGLFFCFGLQSNLETKSKLLPHSECVWSLSGTHVIGKLLIGHGMSWNLVLKIVWEPCMPLLWHLTLISFSLTDN